MSAEQLTEVAVLAAVVSALGTAMAAVYTHSGSATSKRLLTEAREERSERRQIAINAFTAELGRVIHLSVRWSQTDVIAEAIAGTLDYSELNAPDWGAFVLVLGQLGQTGAVLATTGYGYVRDAAIYGRRLKHKVAEYHAAVGDRNAGDLAPAEFDARAAEWRDEVQHQIVQPLLRKLSDAHEAMGEALVVSKVEDRRGCINMQGLTSQAALRWAQAQA